MRPSIRKELVCSQRLGEDRSLQERLPSVSQGKQT